MSSPSSLPSVSIPVGSHWYDLAARNDPWLTTTRAHLDHRLLSKTVLKYIPMDFPRLSSWQRVQASSQDTGLVALATDARIMPRPCLGEGSAEMEKSLILSQQGLNGYQDYQTHPGPVVLSKTLH